MLGFEVLGPGFEVLMLGFEVLGPPKSSKPGVYINGLGGPGLAWSGLVGMPIPGALLATPVAFLALSRRKGSADFIVQTPRSVAILAQAFRFRASGQVVSLHRIVSRLALKSAVYIFKLASSPNIDV